MSITFIIGTLKSVMTQYEESGNIEGQAHTMKLYLDVQRHMKSGADSRILLRNTIQSLLTAQFGTPSEAMP